VASALSAAAPFVERTAPPSIASAMISIQMIGTVKNSQKILHSQATKRLNAFHSGEVKPSHLLQLGRYIVACWSSNSPSAARTINGFFRIRLESLPSPQTQMRRFRVSKSERREDQGLDERSNLVDKRDVVPCREIEQGNHDGNFPLECPFRDAHELSLESRITKLHLRIISHIDRMRLAREQLVNDLSSILKNELIARSKRGSAASQGIGD
jgi:hypothetical protein